MQEDVGEQRADARALGRSFHRIGVHTTLEDAGAEPLADQPQDSRVGNPVRQHSPQPVVVNAVKVSADVGIENPVHRLRCDGIAHHPQRLMSTAPGSEAKGAIEEVGFIDSAQNLRHRALDDFIFQREDAERPLTAVSLWDVRPANR
jgi:hypothetical protein